MARITRSKFYTALTLAISLGVVCSFAFLFLHSARARTSENQSGAKAATSSQNPPAGCIPCLSDKDADKPHLLATAYYSVKDDLKTVLMLNNKGPKPLEANPTLFSLSGERFDLPPVTVEGLSYRELDLRNYGIAGTAFEEGSLQVFHRGKDLVLGVQVKLIDEQHSLIFDDKLVELAKEFNSQQLEGVWWLPSHKTEIRLAVANTTDAALSATVNVYGSAPKQKEPMTLNLMPHETRVMNVQRDVIGKRGGGLAEAGGISIKHSGASGALLARGFIAEPSAGYSSFIKFSDPQKAKSSKLQGAGLRIGKVAGEELTPVAVARNLGNSSSIVTGRIPYTLSDGSTGIMALPETVLSPGEAKAIDLARAIKVSRIVQEDIATAGLEFE